MSKNNHNIQTVYHGLCTMQLGVQYTMGVYNRAGCTPCLCTMWLGVCHGQCTIVLGVCYGLCTMGLGVCHVCVQYAMACVQ